ncbi:MAG: DUF4355 domain-containing protein [Hydrogenoanaerobacterium sp.]
MEYYLKQRTRKYRKAWRCFADGGTAKPETLPPEKAQPLENSTEEKPKVQTQQQSPAETAPPAKTYSEDEVQAVTQKALDEYKQHLAEAKDYEKMTAEEKVEYLEKQRESDKLAQYTTAQLVAQELPPELLQFVQGSTEADTNERIKTFKAAYDKGVQAGVEKRFKANGYLPRGTAAGETNEETSKRPRGVTVV